MNKAVTSMVKDDYLPLKWRFLSKEDLLNIGKLIGNILLLFLAIIIYICLPVIAIPWKIYVSIFHENRKARDIMSAIGTTVRGMAIGVNQTGNVTYGGLFNALLVVDKKTYPFGQPGKTISATLGWNNYLSNLTLLGQWLRISVDFCSKLLKDNHHCERAMLRNIAKGKADFDKYKGSWVNHESIEKTKEFLNRYKK